MNVDVDSATCPPPFPLPPPAPPGPGVAPPPPPPPPPGMAGPLERRTVSRGVRLRTLAWSKLPASRVARQRNSVWWTDDVTGTAAGAAALDVEEMERLFSVDSVTSQIKIAAGGTTAGSYARAERKKTSDEVRLQGLKLKVAAMQTNTFFKTKTGTEQDQDFLFKIKTKIFQDQDIF